MIISIFFMVASIGLIIFVPLYVKKKNKLYNFEPQEKSVGIRKQRKDIRKMWGIDRIQDGILTIKGRHSIIVELGSIEYKLLNDEEQHNIDINLIKLGKTFMNQFQFFSTTEKIDTTDKIEAIRKNLELQNDNNIKEYGESIIEYLEDIMQEDDLYVRKNYCIIDSFEPYEKAKIELDKYYNDFKYNLATIKVKAKRLSDMDIMEFINREFNKNPNEKIKDIIKKGGLDLYVRSESKA